MRGVIYTETVVHSAPTRLVEQAPYQVVMVDLDSGERITGRMASGRVRIGDQVEVVETRDGVPCFQLIPERNGS
jgi:uncharacterized OB-fold protein